VGGEEEDVTEVLNENDSHYCTFSQGPSLLTVEQACDTPRHFHQGHAMPSPRPRYRLFWPALVSLLLAGPAVGAAADPSTAGSTADPAQASEACDASPAWRALRHRLPDMKPSAAVRAVQRHVAFRPKPQPCELAQIDRALDPVERSLVVLQAGTRRLPAQAVFRCEAIDPGTAQCRGPVPDATLDPARVAIATADLPAATSGLDYQLPQARLTAVYRIGLADALEGKPATRLDPAKGGFMLMKDGTDWILIAIIEAKGPWRYRKAVWYFR
jgi:hypothetical protein